MKLAPERIIKELKSFSIFEYFSAYTIIATLVCVLLINLSRTNVLNELGSYLTGLGTFGLFMITLFQVPAAIEKYNLQRRRDKMAEFAYDLTDKSLKYINALRSLTSPLVMAHESVNPETGAAEEGQISQFRNFYNFRINLIKKDLQNFSEITWKAVAIDDQELTDLLKQLEKCWISLRATALTIITFSNDRDDLRAARQFFDEWYDVSSLRKSKLNELEERIVQVLKKYY